MNNKAFVGVVRVVTAAALLALFAVGPVVAAQIQYLATLSGPNESPPNASPGTGNVTITIAGGVGHLGVAEAYLTHVTVTGSTNSGVLADSVSGGATLASVTNSAISANGVGVRATGGPAKLVVATSTLARNTSFAMDNSGATLLSRGDNTVHDNNGGGAQTNGAIGASPPL